VACVQWAGTQGDMDVRVPRPRCLLLAAVFMALPAASAAQTAGAVRGAVTDAAGRPIEGVTIAVDSAALGVTGRGARSDSLGRFQVGSLPPGGDYKIGATCPGFAAVTLTDVEVSAGQVTNVALTLQKESEALREHVEVRATAPIVNLGEVTSQARFTSEFIDALPILGRNYQDLLALAPGVSDVDGDGNPNIHGARDTDVITLVDGVSTTDPLTGKIGAQLNIESIQEIEVKTAGATAEYSRAQGGFANIITKSGGNDFEGTFKVFWRGSALDGDGAGTDDPRLHAGLGEAGLRDLTFNDILPFLSLSGPIVRDRAWFFLASEYIQVQEPVNALSTAFVTEERESRHFAKLTWQAAPSHRLALSLNYDPQEYLNQGVNSFTRVESGYTVDQGGPIVTARWVGVLSPNTSLETALSSFDERPGRSPTLDPDTNGNGLLWGDRNGNQFSEVSEYDPGEDYDSDGVFDVFEDFLLPKGQFDPLREDVDGDRRQTPPFACEGAGREDIDCDGHLDTIAEDQNGNGVLDPLEDVDADGRLDSGLEDRNGNSQLDDTPRPQTTYPYGRTQPIAADRFYAIDQRRGITSGPYYQDFQDSRRRLTFRQDLTLFVPDFYGSHDLKMGFIVERENFDRVTEGRPITAPLIRTQREGPSTVRTLIPSDTEVENEAEAFTGGIYLQDAYKPFPNLSIGLGLRFDREATDSFGYTFFDPAAERVQFDRLNALAGYERRTQDDVVAGNNDGILSRGIQNDPIFLTEGNIIGIDNATKFIVDPLRTAALARMTRHHTEASFVSERLALLFPGINSGDEVSAALLLSLGVLPQQQEAFRLTNNNLAPRLSVAWDPFSDGRTKVYATWGRYYDKLFLNTIVGEEGPDTINRYYVLDPDGVAGQGVPNRQIGQVVSKAPPSATQVDRGLQTPYSDEFTVGFERELAPEMALSVMFIRRDYREQLQDIDVNHTLRLDPSTGEPRDDLGRLPAAFGTGGATIGRQADGRPDLYINNFFFNQVLRVGNYNQARYRGLEIELVKRLSRRWEMQGSYAYSRAVGDAEDYQSRLGNDPSTIESEFGYLDYDQRHVVKLNASLFLPRDWQMGWTAAWGSGLPYSVVSRFFALDNVDYQQFRTLYGYSVPGPTAPVFLSEQRNTHRNDSTLVIGARARKTFVIGRNTAGLFLEVFNLLNSDDLRVLTYEPVPPDLGISPEGVPQGPLQINGLRQFGRRFQVGFQIDF